MDMMDTDNFDAELCQRPETDSFDLAPIEEESPTMNKMATTQDDVDMPHKESIEEYMDVDMNDDEENENASPRSGSGHPFNSSPLSSSSMKQHQGPSVELGGGAAQQQHQMASPESMRPIAILIDELAREDLSSRLNAMRQLKRIALALGASRTRNELIPYLTEMIDDDDEILMVMIESIFELIPDSIGGVEHVGSVLAPFERLCVVEEKMIRDVAVEKLGVMIGMMMTQVGGISAGSSDAVIGLCRRLCESDWHTARVSGVRLIGKIYGHCCAGNSNQNGDGGGPSSSSIRREIEQMFVASCDDDIPVVRRACVDTIGEMVSCEAVTGEEVIEFYVPLFRKLVNDTQDNVRVVAPAHVVSFAKRLSGEEIEKHLMAYVIRELINDSSWRVRYMVSCHYVDIVRMWTKLNRNDDPTHLLLPVQQRRLPSKKI